MVLCVACGARLPEAARFCPACGTAVFAEAPAQETLKLVTVLFADLVSSTAHVESMHPEDVRALMVEYFTAMAEEIVAEGGAVEKFVGDAIMAVFGVPLAHEDDALRAVRAGRRMLARLARWNEGRGASEQLQIRIGINTGEVLAASEVRGDLLVSGDAVHVAARLQEAAEPGAIVLGEATSRLVSDAFELRELGPLTLKGRSAPVSAWVVVRELEAPASPLRPRVHVPMVGRERELEQLRAILARVEAGPVPRLVTIVGDPGVGKSRLAEEFVASLDPGTKVVFGRCPAYGEGVTLWPLGEILSSEAGVLGNDPPDTAFAKIAALVARVVSNDAASGGGTASALASTLGLEGKGEALDDLDPREIRHRLVSAWRLLLTGLAAEHTLVVFVEDLHWGDEMLFDVLDDLAEHAEGPILFLCTARPEVLRLRPDWGGDGDRRTSVALGPLAPDESELLVSLLADAGQLSGPVRQSILGRAEGNPFFLEEIVRRLLDERLVARRGGPPATADLVDLEIPETVQGVILARLDLLSPAERRALQEAAVVGRVFWSGAVGRLVEVEDLASVLEALCVRELIVERPSSSIAGETEFSFKHVLTRDVAYESLPRRERAHAHVRVAAWIEKTSGERLAELTEILAHHYDVAHSLSRDDDLRASARRYYLLASRRAVRQFAIAQAERLGRQVVRLSVDGPELGEALEALGDLFATAHAGDAAWRAYGDALDAFDGDLGTRARLSAKAAVQATRWYGGMGEHPSRRDLERLIESGLEATGDSDSVWRALLLMSRGFELIWGYTRDEAACEEAARTALAIAERLDDPDLLSGTLDAVGSLLLARGLYGAHLRFGRRRIELVPRLTDVAEIGDAFVMGAWSAIYVGLYEEALGHATACIERTRGIDPGEYVHGSSWRVWARVMTGDWDGALQDQGDLERIQAETASALPMGYTLRAYSAVSFVHELRGDEERATAYLDLIRQFVEEQPSSSLDRYAALALAARALAHRGHVAEAGALLGEAGSLSAPPTLEARCEIVAAAEDWEAAPEVIASARRQAEVSEARALPLLADRLEGRLAVARGDPKRAARLLRRSTVGFAEIGAPWEEACSRRLLAEALLDAGRGTEAENERDAARAVFDRLGAVAEHERA